MTFPLLFTDKFTVRHQWASDAARQLTADSSVAMRVGQPCTMLSRILTWIAVSSPTTGTTTTAAGDPAGAVATADVGLGLEAAVPVGDSSVSLRFALTVLRATKNVELDAGFFALAALPEE